MLKDWIGKYVGQYVTFLCRNGGWEAFVRDGSQCLMDALNKRDEAQQETNKMKAEKLSVKAQI